MAVSIWSPGQNLGGIRRFVLLRHGESEGSNLRADIIPEAVAQIREKSPEIEQRLFEGLPHKLSYTVFSSHIVRAVETAVQYFRGSNLAYWVKSDKLFYSQDWSDIADSIHNSTEEVAVIIVHLEGILDFPPYYCKQHLGKIFTPLGGRYLGNFCGVIIDRENKTCDPI